MFPLLRGFRENMGGPPNASRALHGLARARPAAVSGSGLPACRKRMEKRFAALRILLFASLLLALAAGAAFAAAIPGTCSGTITKNPCPTYDYDTCIRVAGCSADHPGGYCKAASGGNINGHTYEWYCTGVAAGIGYDTCQSNDQMSNGIWYHPARNAHECRIYPCCVPNPDGTSTCPLGCTWTGQECAGTATGSCSP